MPFLRSHRLDGYQDAHLRRYLNHADSHHTLLNPTRSAAVAPRHLGSRDRYIGWSAEARRRNIRFIAYNTRFLILPWVSVPHLASHLLGKVTRTLSDDWERMYGHPVYFAETFIDPERFRGTCYRAANWQLLGLTTGRGKNDHTNKPNRPIKEILGLALTHRFRQLLQQL
jgi:hypothetical protein